MRVYSPVLKERFPLKYVMPGAGGANLSPPIEWEGIPENTKSLVLVCVDLHPIARNWIHWCVINIPSTVKGFSEGASLKEIQAPAKELINSYGFKGYGGPQPPPGTGDHPYVFKLWALKVSEIKIGEKPTYEEILKAIKPQVIGEAEFTVYFGR
ncbi:MAG: YbhB/YbcL family Raf kinase inhibitor-like protein [Thermodesulfobacteriaceae bacterium]|nr:YbhB/YbcL family Raf kinase inhibitor-like protein [Thermodesulfobacteriaceae bacterium]MCX8041449.1 YbhB/YbcL family Raf kinase inhibitor-like protein [Thermodesulfobacteriaceae bacterium]MDW8135768.1 YbhB/YbcL family Raf kinase inhibitor-like protein [Thermodesulfobacterium sp.]